MTKVRYVVVVFGFFVLGRVFMLSHLSTALILFHCSSHHRFILASFFRSSSLFGYTFH